MPYSFHNNLRMEHLLTLLLTVNMAFAFISIEVQNSTEENGETVIGIHCDVNGKGIDSVISIQLTRSSQNTVSIAMQKGIIWQDRVLESRNGVSVNASISNAASSYLHLHLLSSTVRYREVKGEYQCILSAFGAKNDLITGESRKVSLNSTGFEKQSAYDTSSLGTSLRLPVVECVLRTMLIQTI